MNEATTKDTKQPKLSPSQINLFQSCRLDLGLVRRLPTASADCILQTLTQCERDRNLGIDQNRAYWRVLRHFFNFYLQSMLPAVPTDGKYAPRDILRVIETFKCRTPPTIQSDLARVCHALRQNIRDAEAETTES